MEGTGEGVGGGRTTLFWDCHLRTKAFLINDFAGISALISPSYSVGQGSKLQKN